MITVFLDIFSQYNFIQRLSYFFCFLNPFLEYLYNKLSIYPYNKSMAGKSLGFLLFSIISAYLIMSWEIRDKRSYMSL